MLGGAVIINFSTVLANVLPISPATLLMFNIKVAAIKTWWLPESAKTTVDRGV